MYCKNGNDSHDIVDLFLYKNSYESSDKLDEKIKNIEKNIIALEKKK